MYRGVPVGRTGKENIKEQYNLTSVNVFVLTIMSVNYHDERMTKIRTLNPIIQGEMPRGMAAAKKRNKYNVIFH